MFAVVLVPAIRDIVICLLFLLLVVARALFVCVCVCCRLFRLTPLITSSTRSRNHLTVNETQEPAGNMPVCVCVCACLIVAVKTLLVEDGRQSQLKKSVPLAPSCCEERRAEAQQESIASSEDTSPLLSSSLPFFPSLAWIQ